MEENGKESLRADTRVKIKDAGGKNTQFLKRMRRAHR